MLTKEERIRNARAAAKARWKNATEEDRARQGLNFSSGLSPEDLSERNRANVNERWKDRKRSGGAA